MSRYGEEGFVGYKKEDLYYEIESFLKDHTVSELLSVLTDVIENMEYYDKSSE